MIPVHKKTARNRNGGLERKMMDNDDDGNCESAQDI